MSESSVQKCRACLRNSANTVPLTKYVMGCNPRSTYGQLLQEYASLECIADYEGFMPQYMCLICSQELRNIYEFIKQARYCNDTLINVISKKLECLQERTIDLPEKENDLEKGFEEKVEMTIDDCHNTERDELSLLGFDAEEPENTKTTYHFNDVELVEIIDNDQNDSNDDLPLQFFSKAENNDNVIIPNEKSQTDSTCPICEENLCSLENLIKHVRIQHDIENPSKFLKIDDKIPVKCSSSTDNEELIDDNDTENTQTDSVCPICEKKFSSHESLIKHLRMQHDVENSNKFFNKLEEKKVFTCKFCLAEYTKQHNYLYHLKHHHRSSQITKIIKCHLCNYVAGTHASLSYHKRAKHGTEKDKFKCNFCSNMYFQKYLLMKHMKSSHKEQIKTLKADADTEGGTKTDANTDNTALNRQSNKSHSTASSNTETEEETEQSSDEEFLRNILNIKKRQTKLTSKPLAIKCDECGNIYKDHKSLYIHQKSVHITQDKYSSCPHCERKYKRKANLKIHIKQKHTEKTHISKVSTEITKQPPKVKEKRFMCTKCSYVCGTISVLNIHMNRHHTGEKPYKCDICFKSFIVKYDLKTHRYLHTGERPYKCPVCSKGFRDSSHMLKHKRIHSSERPYKCKECSKTFTLSYNLSVHRRMHLKEKKLNCVVCGKIFENRSLLNLHRISENHHDEDI